MTYPIVNMSLFLTQSCNLRCVYCYGDGGAYGRGSDMDEATAFRAVDWLIEHSGTRKNIYIGFFGGEPFLRFLLMQTVAAYGERQAAAAGKKVGFHATTNATVLNDEMIDFIQDRNMALQVSIDGPREIHDAQRPDTSGAGSYDSIVPNIKKLLRVMPQTLAHAVLVGGTDPEMVKDALQELGFAEVSIKAASDSLFAAAAQPGHSPRDISQILAKLEHEAARWLDGVRRRDGSALAKLKNRSSLYSALKTILHNSKRRHACGAGLGLAAVSAAGDVYLCHRFVGHETYKLGSIFGSPLNRPSYGQPAECADCVAQYYCAGGCKYDNLAATGSITTPAADMCRLRRREMKLAADIVSCLTAVDKDYLAEEEVIPPKPCPLDF